MPKKTLLCFIIISSIALSFANPVWTGSGSANNWSDAANWNANAVLAWKPNSYSPSPYMPYWKIDIDGHIWYVTQDSKVISG